MKSIYTIAIVLSLHSTYAFASFKEQICAAQSPQKKLVEVYALERVFNGFQSLHNSFLERPPKDLKAMELSLLENYNAYLLEIDMVARRNEVFLDQPQYVQDALFQLLNSYLAELETAREKASFEVTDLHIPPSEHPLKIQELVAKKKLELLKVYRPEMLNILNEAKTISKKGRAFLIKWTLDYIPNKPLYYWGQSAEQLHRFMWNTIHAEKPINPTGRFAFGSFWVETNVISAAPGLNLNIAPRMTDHTKNMNIRFKLSPFNDKLETYACDFSKNPNGCTLQTLDEWCGFKPTFLQRFLGLNY